MREQTWSLGQAAPVHDCAQAHPSRPAKTDRAPVTTPGTRPLPLSKERTSMNTRCVLGLLWAVGMVGCATSGGAGAVPARAPAVLSPVGALGSSCRVTGK